MNKAYSRINWENYPSDSTPINERNLNKIDAAVDEIDNRVVAQDATKLDKTTAATMVKDVIYDESTGIFTVTYLNGATIILDTKMEKLAVNFDYDKENQQLIISLDDGTKQYVDLSTLITEYEFADTDTIAFTIDSAGKVSAIVKDGSITEDKLQPNFLADVKVEVAKAQASASESSVYSKISKSYAIGTDGEVRENDNADNAKYYYEQAKQISQGLNGIIPMGTVAFADLPTSGMNYGWMYNISDDFTSDERFNDGGGIYYGAGNNVIWMSDDKWDVTASSGVTGVKGDKETAYRQGNVNITPKNIGALAEDGDTNNNSVTFTTADSISSAEWTDVEQMKSGEKHSSLFNKISTMFKNMRYLYKMLGSTDISAIGDGTTTGAIAAQNETFAKQISELNTNLATKANTSDLSTKASNTDLNAEKSTRASVDASLQSQINDTKAVSSFAFGTIISDVAEFSDGYLLKKDDVVYFSFEFKIINIRNETTTNIASIPYKPYGICHCSAAVYNGNTSFPVFTSVNDGVIQVHLPSDCVLSSTKANNKLRFSGSFPIVP